MANTTFNPSDKAAVITLSGGNLIATATATSFAGVRAIDNQATGKFYWEVTWNATTGSNNAIGVILGGLSLTVNYATASTGACVLASTGSVWTNGTATSGLLTAANGQVVCIAIDISAGLVWFRQDAGGNWNGSGAANPATGAGGKSWPYVSPVYPFFQADFINEKVTANFGDSAFTGALPAGFTAGFPPTGSGGGAAAQARAMVLA